MWANSAFVVNEDAVAFDLIPDSIRRLYLQVAWGTMPQPVDPFWIATAKERGLELWAWAWCNGGGDVEAEAQVHSEAARAGYAGFSANMEEAYDAHGNSGDPKYGMPARYLAALNWNGPLAVTTTPRFASDMSAWIARGAVHQPQAFPLENHNTITQCVEFSRSWGWPLAQIRPLVQSYPTNGERPDPAAMNAEATQLGVGVVPYTLEQAHDDAGQAWLAVMAPSISRPNPAPEKPPEPPVEPPEEDAVKVGEKHGINAALSQERKRYPEESKRSPKWKESDPNSWPVCERVWRRETIMWASHDEVELAEPVLPPAP